MRIRTWNVNKAFQKKADAALAGDLDIAIFQECIQDPQLEGCQWRWLGRNPNSGLGIAAKQGMAMSELTRIGTDEEWIGTVDFGDFCVIAVWSCYGKSPGIKEKGR